MHPDGRFLGWVNPEICERYGIPGAPEEAWEAGGGGHFSFKIDKKGELERRCQHTTSRLSAQGGPCWPAWLARCLCVGA